VSNRVRRSQTTIFGRDEIEWDELTRAGERFLTERAQLEKMTTYTALNAVLARRTGLRPFDFDQQSERADVGTPAAVT
jgi:hypothetical protein